MSEQPSALSPAIAAIIQATDTGKPENADSFAAEPLEALAKANGDVGAVLKVHLPQILRIFADELTQITQAGQALSMYRDTVSAKTDNAERFAVAASGHTASHNAASVCGALKGRVDTILGELYAKGDALTASRAALGDHIAAGQQILLNLGAGETPPEEGSYADKLGKRLTALQGAFATAVETQQKLRTGKKALLPIQELAEDVGESLAATDSDFLKMMQTNQQAAPAPAPVPAG